MPVQQVRPVSTYDNLGVSQSRQLTAAGMAGEPEAEVEVELNGSHTSHSIAAVKAALNDAKSKFFGINNYESPVASKSAAGVTTMAKPEPRYQNVPQREELPAAAAPDPPAQPAQPPAPAGDHSRALRYATTYEQIPLSDLEAPLTVQAVYMSTTVPQNMKGTRLIAGRHTPTRNSLRHSRMIVVNHKNHDSLQATRNLNISRQLLVMQLAVGLFIVALAAWILILAPNASILINPYLSGLSLLLASIAGLILLRRDHKITEHRPPNSCYKVLLAESYVFTGLALIFCCLALVCAAIEFAELISSADGECGPTSSSLLSYHNCTCLAAGEMVANYSSSKAPTAFAADQEEPSQNDGCAELRIEWKYLLAFSMALNTLGIVATFLYITLFICCHRKREHFYTSV
ncbi:GM13248 [Drosophila sechellia]|uniref:GM13248 n=1 Tax=Drosophila sechellia TaxID=7238 RepID=B4ILA5_DROSE|nr:GM13248 [Drosophila sechellia]